MFHCFQWGWFEALSILKRIDNNSCEKMWHIVDVSDVCTARHIHSPTFFNFAFFISHFQHNTHHNRRRCAPSTVCATTASSGDIWYDMHTFTHIPLCFFAFFTS